MTALCKEGVRETYLFPSLKKPVIGKGKRNHSLPTACPKIFASSWYDVKPIRLQTNFWTLVESEEEGGVRRDEMKAK